MTPQEYVKKYKLNENANFSYDDFFADFSRDFMNAVEVKRAIDDDFSLKKFHILIDEARKKWDGIDNKTAGKLPEFIWSKFYAKVAMKLKEDIFDQVEDSEILQMGQQELLDFLKEELKLFLLFYEKNYIDLVNSLANHHSVQSALEGIQEDIWRKYNIKLRILRSEMKTNIQSIPRLKQAIHRFIAVLGQDVYSKATHNREESKKWKQQERRFHSSFDDMIHWFWLLLKQQEVVPEESFKFLEITPTKDSEAINSAYRKLAIKYHPDKGGKQEKFVTLVEHKNKCLQYATQE